jgi:hypothetical protein
MDDHVKYLDCSPDLRNLFYAAALVYIASLALRKETSLFYPMTILSLLGFVFLITDKRGATAQAVLMASPLLINFSIIIAIAAKNISQLSHNLVQRSSLLLALLAIYAGISSWTSWAFKKASYLQPVETKIDPVKAGQPSEFSVWLNKYSKPGDHVMFLETQSAPLTHSP